MHKKQIKFGYETQSHINIDNKFKFQSFSIINTINLFLGYVSMFDRLKKVQLLVFKLTNIIVMNNRTKFHIRCFCIASGRKKIS